MRVRAVLRQSSAADGLRKITRTARTRISPPALYRHLPIAACRDAS